MVLESRVDAREVRRLPGTTSERVRPPSASAAFGLGKGPVDPLRQQRDVLCVHGGAAPDAQARRRIAVMREIVTGAFLLHQRDQLLGEVGLRVRASAK